MFVFCYLSQMNFVLLVLSLILVTVNALVWERVREACGGKVETCMCADAEEALAGMECREAYDNGCQRFRIKCATPGEPLFFDRDGQPA